MGVLFDDIINRPSGWTGFANFSTNLLAYAGRHLQLVFEARRNAPNWEADVGGISLECEHSSHPEFQVFLGTNSTVSYTELVGSAYELVFTPTPLAPDTVYYWRVGAVRDGVIKLSNVASFKTGQRLPPSLEVGRIDETGLRLSFATKLNLIYAVEQCDSLDADRVWYEIVPPQTGTGNAMEVTVPLPQNRAAFWRLRAGP